MYFLSTNDFDGGQNPRVYRGNRIATKYRNGRRALLELCTARRVGIRDVTGKDRSTHIKAVRAEFCILAHGMGLGSVITANLLQVDHTTVLYHRDDRIKEGRKERGRNKRRRAGGNQGAGSGSESGDRPG